MPEEKGTCAELRRTSLCFQRTRKRRDYLSDPRSLVTAVSLFLLRL